VLVAIAGLGGYALLVWLGLDDFEAWAGGRAAGLVAVALPAWWAGVVGLSRWQLVGAVVLALGAAAGVLAIWRRRPWRELVRAEAIFLVGSLVVIALRLGHPEIINTEKPMDLGILASLLRAESFPPPDMWLGGESLPYYYWGALIWTIPNKLAAVPLEYAYNLIVALLGGMLAALMWSLGRRAGGGHGSGLLAAFFGVFAGTPDGPHQILGGVSMTGINLWQSSRQIEGTITEWPLFTLWLGDLHPHLLSMPIACLALLVAWQAGRDGPDGKHTAVLAVLFGVTWAANPWAMPPTFVAIGLLLLAGPERWYWPIGEGRRRWVAAFAIGVGGWLVTAPFHLAFQPFFEGVRRVFAWTAPADLLLYGACLLVPAALAAIGAVRRNLHAEKDVRRAVLLLSGAAVLVLAAATNRPTLVMLLFASLILAATALLPVSERDRPALALAVLGLFLFFVPELVYVADDYGDDLHRMNTVFKSYIQGWVLLAVALPVLLRWGVENRMRRRLLVALMVLCASPHLVGMLGMTLQKGRPGLDGLRWMDDGDRAIVDFLRAKKTGTIVVEAVGPAYTNYGRLSAASGVPALLGWENHELVWRGDEILDETGRRREIVNEIYTCGDTDRVRQLAAENRIDLVAIGTLERQDFNPLDLAAVRDAGEVVLREGKASLVGFANR
jgi:YYY domain-containing protein